ncbi:hypothetical protein L484_000528 [Morus notabilis]|uniref:Uncharacterized protein n=1 Tax=Morus notabilis TaxID=981085 RepID=W9SDU1_9ROSA|nr:hypothetical protein L484_000528 [Morus notabilis]
MAAKHFSLFFFVALLLSASAQAEARESRFFSKVTRLIGTVNKVITEVPTPAPAPAPETSELQVPVPAPVPTASFATETDSGYGLYGTYQQTPPETDVENEMLTEEHAAGDEGFEKRVATTWTVSRATTTIMATLMDMELRRVGVNRRTAERGPRYVFDSMEEYEKYQESQGKSYVP